MRTKQKQTDKQQKHIFVHIVLYVYLAVAIIYTNTQHCIRIIRLVVSLPHVAQATLVGSSAEDSGSP